MKVGVERNQLTSMKTTNQTKMKVRRQYVGIRMDEAIIARIDKLAEMQHTNRRSVIEQLVDMGAGEMESKFGIRD